MVDFEPTPLLWELSLAVVCMLALSKKPDTTKKCPLNREVQDILFTRHSRGFFRLVAEEIEF